MASPGAASAPTWDRLTRSEVDQIIAIQAELQRAGGRRRVLRRTAKILGITVPTLDRVMFTWRRCRAATIARVRAAISAHFGRCLKHTDCAEVPELGRGCYAARTHE